MTCSSWPGVWNWRTECAKKDQNVTGLDEDGSFCENLNNNIQQQCYRDRIESYPRARRTSGEEILREHRVILGTSASTLPRPVPPPHDCKRVGESYGTRQTAYRKPVFNAVSGFIDGSAVTRSAILGVVLIVALNTAHRGRV
ncbi:hypothetical protein G5I_13497 [Acromyrmex echinatior]|uniref:Uncharacterized protein n=1 Tax=Acromyrmex echinatior TaxID=103372 RepID=F4X572_ACREC|nr:hypothetical protein G5I_13497 [Acromyrmex echinatior]